MPQKTKHIRFCLTFRSNLSHTNFYEHGKIYTFIFLLKSPLIMYISYKKGYKASFACTLFFSIFFVPYKILSCPCNQSYFHIASANRPFIQHMSVIRIPALLLPNIQLILKINQPTESSFRLLLV